MQALVGAVLQKPYSGRDFSEIGARLSSQSSLCRCCLPGSNVLLDMDTGAGEFLSAPPGKVLAMEKHSLNIVKPKHHPFFVYPGKDNIDLYWLKVVRHWQPLLQVMRHFLSFRFALNNNSTMQDK